MRTRAILPLALMLGLATALAGCEGGEPLAPDSSTAGSEEIAALLATASEDGPVEDVSEDTTSAARVDGETDHARPIRRRHGRSVFHELAEKIPSFGGLYRVAPCVVALVLTDLSEAERAIEIVKHVIEPLVVRGCPDGIRVEAVEGQYTYTQLLRIRRALRPLHLIPGVVGARIDFEQNKVIIGVASREVVDEVRQAVARIGVPWDALGIELRMRDAHR
jgi:hypothetical protein